MKPLAIFLALNLGIGLTLLPGSAWAGPSFQGGFPGGIHSGHGRFFVGHRHHFFRHHFFFHHGFIHPHFTSPFIGVQPVPKAVWPPGSWRWNGFAWVWVPSPWGW